MSEPTELLPCPCGAPAMRDDSANKSPESIVRCTVCTFAAFITDWNTRVHSPAPIAKSGFNELEAAAIDWWNRTKYLPEEYYDYEQRLANAVERRVIANIPEEAT